ncbi:MAG: Ig-like domain-containing protein [Butyrivibrio sp.]|nr:Ig-like domain-containing protein [Butyrivibrio sp.]
MKKTLRRIETMLMALMIAGSSFSLPAFSATAFAAEEDLLENEDELLDTEETLPEDEKDEEEPEVVVEDKEDELTEEVTDENEDIPAEEAPNEDAEEEEIVEEEIAEESAELLLASGEQIRTIEYTNDLSISLEPDEQVYVLLKAESNFSGSNSIDELEVSNNIFSIEKVEDKVEYNGYFRNAVKITAPHDGQHNKSTEITVSEINKYRMLSEYTFTAVLNNPSNISDTIDYVKDMTVPVPIGKTVTVTYDANDSDFDRPDDDRSNTGNIKTISSNSAFTVNRIPSKTADGTPTKIQITASNGIAVGESTDIIVSKYGPFSWNTSLRFKAVTIRAGAAVDSVSFDSDSLSLTVGDTWNASEHISVLPVNAEDKSYTLTSSANDVVSVEGTTLTAVKAGTAVITATTTDSGKTDTIEVTVTEPTVPVEDIQFTDYELTVDAGYVFDADEKIRFNPSNATNKNFSITVDNENVGKISGHKVTLGVNGQATNNVTITATTEDGGKTTTCYCFVKAKNASIVAPISKNTTYCGAAQALINAGSVGVTGASMKYRLGTTGSYNTAIPTATEKGTYKVYHKVEGLDADLYEIPAEDFVEVTISPASLAAASVTLGDALTYTGTEQTQTVESVTLEGFGSLTEGVDYTVSGNKQTSVGNYELTITGIGNFTGTKKVPYSIASLTGLRVTAVENDKCEITGAGAYEGGDSVTVTASPAPGYTFSKWIVNDSEEVTTNPYTFTIMAATKVEAVVTANTNTAYTVRHFKVDGSGVREASPFKTESLTGTTDTPATINYQDVENYEAIRLAAIPTIKGDESLVIDIEYAPVAVHVTGVSFVANTVPESVVAGQTISIGSWTVSPENATNKDVTFTSSNEDAITVANDGKITGVAPGTSTITVKTVDGEFTDTAIVTCVAATIAAESVAFNDDVISEVGVGETVSIGTWTVSPSDASNKAVTFESSDENVLTVDNDGKVTGVSEGQATVTVKTVDQNKTATTTVSVVRRAVHVESVTLDKSEVIVNTNGTDTLTATVSPSNADNKNVTWVSNNENIATIADGVVTGVSHGITSVKAISEDGNHEGSAAVYVRYAIPNIVQYGNTLTGFVAGETYSITPAGSEEVTITADAANIAMRDGWYEKDLSIVCVDNEEAKCSSPAQTLTTTAKSDIPDDGLYMQFEDNKDEFIYTGAAIKPAVKVYNNGILLKEGTDYTIKYSNNVNVSYGKKTKEVIANAKAVVTGKKNLTKSYTAKFKILPKTLGDGEVYEDDIEVGKIIVAKNSKATPVITYHNVKLGSKDYTIKNANKKYTENDIMELSGKNNYKGTIEIPVNVVSNKKALKKMNVVADTKTAIIYDPSKTEDDMLAVLADKIKVYDSADKNKKHALANGEDYELAFPANVTDVGTKKITVIGKGNYSGTVTKSLTVKPLVTSALADATSDGIVTNAKSIRDGAGYVYTGSAVTIGNDLTVVYKDKNGAFHFLREGKDFKLTYSNNKAVSTDKKKATYTISFIGNYKGTKALKNAKTKTTKITDYTFTITGSVISKVDGTPADNVRVSVPDVAYSGKPNLYKSAPIVEVGGKVIPASNYTVTYFTDAEMQNPVSSKNKVSLAKDQMFATVYVNIKGKGNVGKGNFVGSIISSYHVFKKYVPTDPSVEPTAPIDLSTATVAIYKKGYVAGAKSNKKLSSVTYTGRERHITDEDVQGVVVVTYKMGKQVVTLEEGVDYELVYYNNKNVGTATIEVRGLADPYAGSKKATFKIVKKSVATTPFGRLAQLVHNGN